MRSKTGKLAIALMLVLPLVLGLANGVLANGATAGDEFALQVSPHVLNLDSYGGSVSLHTNIGYSTDLVVDLTVQGIQDFPILGTFADSRGELVVKCSVETVKEIAELGAATFVLTLELDGVVVYEAEDTITIISQSGVGRSR